MEDKIRQVFIYFSFQNYAVKIFQLSGTVNDIYW